MAAWFATANTIAVGNGLINFISNILIETCNFKERGGLIFEIARNEW